MKSDTDRIEAGIGAKGLIARNVELEDKTKVMLPKGGRQYISQRRKTVDHAAIRRNAKDKPYTIESELAKGAESVLYVGNLQGQQVCIKCVRGFLNKIIGDSVTRRQEERLEKVSYGTKVRHIVNEFEVSRLVCSDQEDMPLVHIYALRKVKKFGLELGYDLIMEYLAGHDLADKSLVKILSLEDKMDVFVQAIQALCYFHSKRLIHLDIKPSNFILNNGRVKLIDFGVSVGDGFKPMAITGTGGYLSPEQICKAPLNGATDVFALGVTFAVFFGAKPLNQPQSSLMQKQFRVDAKYHLEKDNRPNIIDIPELDDYPELQEIIRECTIPRRDLRISSSQGLLLRVKDWAKSNNITLPSLANNP
jgi:serine/threonine protein kinase